MAARGSRARNEPADAGDSNGAAALQETRAGAVDAAESVDRERAGVRQRREAAGAEGADIGVARRGENRGEQSGIGTGGGGCAQRRRGMGGSGDQPVPLPAHGTGAPDGALRQMDPVSADPPRECRVFAHQQDEPPPARNGGKAAGEHRTLRRSIMTEDDAAPRRQRVGSRERIGEPRLVGHQQERRQAAPRRSFEACRRLC